MNSRMNDLDFFEKIILNSNTNSINNNETKIKKRIKLIDYKKLLPSHMYLKSNSSSKMVSKNDKGPILSLNQTCMNLNIKNKIVENSPKSIFKDALELKRNTKRTSTFINNSIIKQNSICKVRKHESLNLQNYLTHSSQVKENEVHKSKFLNYINIRKKTKNSN